MTTVWLNNITPSLRLTPNFRPKYPCWLSTRLFRGQVCRAKSKLCFWRKPSAEQTYPYTWGIYREVIHSWQQVSVMNKSDEICFRWNIPTLVTILTISVTEWDTCNWFLHREVPITVSQNHIWTSLLLVCIHQAQQIALTPKSRVTKGCAEKWGDKALRWKQPNNRIAACSYQQPNLVRVSPITPAKDILCQASVTKLSERPSGAWLQVSFPFVDNTPDFHLSQTEWLGWISLKVSGTTCANSHFCPTAHMVFRGQEETCAWIY